MLECKNFKFYYNFSSFKKKNTFQISIFCSLKKYIFAYLLNFIYFIYCVSKFSNSHIHNMQKLLSNFLLAFILIETKSHFLLFIIMVSLSFTY